MNGLTRGFRRLASGAVFVAGLVAATFSPAAAQTAEQDIERIPLPAGRSYPIHSQVPVTRVSVANPAVADVVVIGERDLVINARAAGETDVIIWTGETRRHFRIIVNPPVDRRQISLGIVFAEVRKDALRQFGVSALYRDNNIRLGMGNFRSDNAINPVTGDGDHLAGEQLLHGADGLRHRRRPRADRGRGRRAATRGSSRGRT